jgi:uncharacterized membrane protein YeaQ/YmgE (transglycosylase-associated protein family)
MELGGFWTTLITGIVLGALGRLVLRGSQPIGWLWTILAGIGGAFVGGWLAGLFGWEGWSLFILQVIAAAILVGVVGRITK